MFPAFCTWLQSAPNMKLNSEAAVLYLTHKEITDYEFRTDFDNATIKLLTKVCR